MGTTHLNVNIYIKYMTEYSTILMRFINEYIDFIYIIIIGDKLWWLPAPVLDIPLGGG
jgi:hypothetical protein